MEVKKPTIRFRYLDPKKLVEDTLFLNDYLNKNPNIKIITNNENINQLFDDIKDCKPKESNEKA